MSKRSIIILLVIVAAGLILAVAIPPLLSSPSQIAQKAAGTWQETGETPAYTMQVVGAGSTYLVTYPRWRYDRERASVCRATSCSVVAVRTLRMVASVKPLSTSAS